MNLSRSLLFLSLLTFFCFFPSVYAAETLDEEMVADSSIDHSPTYNLYDDVDMISTEKFRYGRPRVIIKSVYPQLASDTDNDAVNNFNQLVTQLVEEEITKFKSIVKTHAATQKQMAKNKLNNNLYIDYATSYFKSGKSHILSVRFIIQGYIANLEHPYHYHKVINYNIDEGQPIQLSDLFTPGTNYLAALSDYASNSLARRLHDKQIIANSTAPVPENFVNWNIKSNGLLITFDENQDANYVDGAQTVLIPYEKIKMIIANDSPVHGCATHRSRCNKNNLLTGGFIDEARKSSAEMNLTA